MRILIDIGHPAHVHFFHHPIRELQARGHELLITSRKKEIALDLLDDLGLEHIPLSEHLGGGVKALGGELIRRNRALYRVVRERRPEVMAAIGGIFIAQVGRLTGVPSLVFYDTENATLQNALTYPFASRVIVPRCYGAWLPRRRGMRYAGYHELSYLHPQRFTPDRDTALRNGLAENGDTFFLRLVSWQANHDIGEKGWSRELLLRVVERLDKLGKVIISSEAPLDGDLAPFRYSGRVGEVHHLMACCRLFVGESATMASECAVLGVPAIYAAQTGRGYTDEQEARYGLVRNLFELDWPTLSSAIDDLLDQPRERWGEARRRLLTETIEVAGFVAACIEDYPERPADALPV